MLSILIPVYNHDVRGLVSDLMSQIELIDKPIEIHLLNDGSDSKWANNLNILEESGVSLHNFQSNQGRVASRRKLAELAQYDYLLFIDCDAKVIRSNFIQSYIDNLNEADVICGGHEYQSEIPAQEYILHWKYGTQIEVRTLSDRINKPYRSFSTFNFCCSRNAFNDYLKGIEVSGYGHEDTVMGGVLAAHRVIIRHIDNPLRHAGLKDINQFLKDTESAVDNAIKLKREYNLAEIKLVDFSNSLRKWRIDVMVRWYLNNRKDRILENLKSSNPSLTYLQQYKLLLALNSKL